MTLQDWRKSGERRSLAIDILSQPAAKEMLEVLESEHPGRKLSHLRDGFEASQWAGFIQGYQTCINVLRSLSEPLPEPTEDIPITWNADVPPTETK